MEPTIATEQAGNALLVWFFVGGVVGLVVGFLAGRNSGRDNEEN